MKKLTSIAKIATATTISIGALSISSAAHAASFNSFDLGAEGEVALTNNGSTCLSNATCLQTSPFGFTVTSLDYDGTSSSSNKPSLLFSDNRDTANTYATKSGNFGITFFGQDNATVDEGTNTTLGEYWLRPVAVDKKGKPLEKGRLETGLFKFDFQETVSKLVLNLFDVEYADSTKVIKINGVAQTLASLVAAGDLGDSNIQQITLRNVDNFEIQLGQLGPNSDPNGTSFNTGDGVALQGTAVPEPGVNASLGALGLAAMFGLNRRRNSKAVKFN
ncbi:LEVG family PEP-CTERM protein [Calothrix sp. PCC 6303]|uniref:LEVG family PEP-CTERM protein n=1 Tax=Calothrix sp. PCC 6303 TaxID=1170562 RepID=UPI0002A0314A|nr:LEVG family PEP-CTERM protein [Calothrix sp. PCC 6303]AFZ00598.1 PEP motif putative anchor domain protein [Calothrix sp. PCC 6303]